MQAAVPDTRRRVKVYQLNDDRQWDDRGTGHVTAQTGPEETASLLVRSEADGTILLDSEIKNDTNYSKQQETLIVWSEDSSDLALSFQERAGCEEIWERICQQQGRDPDATDPLQSSDEEPEDDLELPVPEIRNIASIRDNIHNHCRMQRREKLSSAIKNQNYIPKLLELFRTVEDLEDTTSLRTLYEIFKSIWMLNQGEIYEILFKQEYIFDVVGIMEYDPSRKDDLKHRDYLRKIATFQNVLPIKDEALAKKINQTYRMQYVQESVLPAPSMFEQDNLATLASFVFFSKVDVVKMLMKEPDLIETCLTDLKEPTTSPNRQVELCGFLKEFFIYSQNLQQAEKEGFLDMLLQKGILPAIEVLLDSQYSRVRTLGAELICQITEQHQQPSAVREYILRSRYANTDGSRRDMMTLLLNVALDDPDPELGTAYNLMHTIRMILDPDNMIRNATEKPDFLGFFYKECIGRLTHYISSVAGPTKMIKDDYQTAHTCVIILDLLMFMVEHHTYHIKNHMMHRDTLKRAMMLIQSRHTFLSLSSLRLLRKIIGKCDETYYKLVIRNELLNPVVEALFKNGKRYNLLNSAILELFKYIHDENSKQLLEYINEKFGERLRTLKYTDIFEKIQTKVLQTPDEQTRTTWNGRFRPHPSPSHNRLTSPSRNDETNWFDIDDEEKTEKVGNRALVDYQDSDSDGEAEGDDPDKTPIPGVSEADQAEIPVPSSDQPDETKTTPEPTLEHGTDEESLKEPAIPNGVPESEVVQATLVPESSEEVKVGEKREPSAENEDSSDPKRARLEETENTPVVTAKAIEEDLPLAAEESTSEVSAAKEAILDLDEASEEKKSCLPEVSS